MKFLGRILLVALLGFFAWAAITYPKVGELAFKAGAAAEASLYGLEKQTVSVGDLDMVIYQGGPSDAPAIVMVHGYTADKDVWPRFAKAFTEDYRVVIPDLAGHGETAFDPSWDYSAAAQSKRIAGLLDALGIDKAHITGNSMGGMITAYFAIHYPQRTLSAMPIDPGGVASPEPSDMLKMLAEGKNPFLVNSAEDFSNFYPMTMAQAPWLPGFVLDAMAQKYMDRQERHAQIFADIENERLEPDLSRLQAPALLLWGREDRLIHVSATKVWEALTPNLRVEILDDIGHMPMVEVPAQTAQIYRDFLQSL